MFSVGTTIKLVSYKAMHKIEEYNGYTGCFPAACDFDLNQGAIWYAYQAVRDTNTHEPDLSNQPPYSISDVRHRLLNRMRMPKFRRESMTIDGFLGSGSYGNVWRGKFGPLGGSYAIKQSISNKNTTELWKERDILIRLKGPRVVNLVGCFHEGDLYMIFELCYCSLTIVRTKISEENKARFTLQLAEAIKWIHKNCIAHCDLRPDNLLITTSNNIVVSDFGLAMPISPGVEVIKSPKLRGKPAYQDYECNTEFKYAKSSDMFSLACILFEIWCGEYLMRYNLKNSSHGRHEYAKVFKEGRVKGLKEGERPDDKKSAREPLTTRVAKTGDLRGMMMGLIAERSNRLTADELLNHETIKELYFRLASNNWKLDNGDDNVIKDFVSIDYDKPYAEINSKSTQETNAAFLGIYYDEEDAFGNEKQDYRKSLQSYDTHVIAKALKEHNLVEKLIQGLADKDPSTLGLVENLVAGYLGRSSEAAKKDIPNVSHGATLHSVVRQPTIDHRHISHLGVFPKQNQTANKLPSQIEAQVDEKQSTENIAEKNAVTLDENGVEIRNALLESNHDNEVNDSRNTKIFKVGLAESIPKCSREFATEFRLDTGKLDGTLNSGSLYQSEKDQSRQESYLIKDIEQPQAFKVAELSGKLVEGTEVADLERQQTKESTVKNNFSLGKEPENISQPQTLTNVPEITSEKLKTHGSTVTTPKNKNDPFITLPPTQTKQKLVSKGTNQIKISDTGHAGVIRTNVPFIENFTEDKLPQLTATVSEPKNFCVSPDLKKIVPVNDDSSFEDACAKPNTDTQETIDESEGAADTRTSNMNRESRKLNFESSKTESTTTKSKEKGKQGGSSKSSRESRSTRQTKTKPKNQSLSCTERTSDSDAKSEHLKASVETKKQYTKASQPEKSKPGVEKGTHAVQYIQAHAETRKTLKRDCSSSDNEDKKRVDGKKFKPTPSIRQDETVATPTFYRCSFCQFGDYDKKTVQRCQKQCRMKQANRVNNKM